MAGYPSSSPSKSPTPTTPRNAATPAHNGRIGAWSNGREGELDQIVLSGAGDRRDHAMKASPLSTSMSDQVEQLNAQFRHNLALSDYHSWNRSVNRALPRFDSVWDLPALIARPQDLTHGVEHLEGQTHQAAATPSVTRQASPRPSTPSHKPPAAPRPGRLATPELDDAHEGMFCDCWPPTSNAQKSGSTDHEASGYPAIARGVQERQRGWSFPRR